MLKATNNKRKKSGENKFYLCILFNVAEKALKARKVKCLSFTISL